MYPREIGQDQQTRLIWELTKRLDILSKTIYSLSSSAASATGWRYYAITTADGVVQPDNSVVGTTTFNLPVDCDISDATNKPMIVFTSPGVTYILGGTNGTATITFSEAPILGDIVRIYYTPII